jgi:Family of unknown function (DUF5372)
MRKNNWGEDRVLYYNAQGRLCSMLVSWTSLELQDAFSLASAGRSWFRVDDLLNLVALLQDARALEMVRGHGVKQNMPSV